MPHIPHAPLLQVQTFCTWRRGLAVGRNSADLPRPRIVAFSPNVWYKLVGKDELMWGWINAWSRMEPDGSTPTAPTKWGLPSQVVYSIEIPSTIRLYRRCLTSRALSSLLHDDGKDKKLIHYRGDYTAFKKMHEQQRATMDKEYKKQQERS